MLLTVAITAAVIANTASVLLLLFCTCCIHFCADIRCGRRKSETAALFVKSCVALAELASVFYFPVGDALAVVDQPAKHVANHLHNLDENQDNHNHNKDYVELVTLVAIVNCQRT